MSHEALFRAGFGPIMLPVIPPNAIIAPNSTVTDPGKTPGKLRGTGWVGVNLKRTDCPSLAEAQQRDQWGASIGFVCGRLGMVCLDNDIGDETVNEKVRALLAQHGIEYVRRSVDDANHKKEAYFFRVVEEIMGTPVEIASKDIRVEFNGQKTAIQILGCGKQFVVEGEHVKTGKPYVCEPALTTFNDVPRVSQPQFEAFIADLQLHLPLWGCTPLSHVATFHTTRAARHEGQVADSEEELREWLEMVPNTEEAFPGRDEWVEMLYAIYGACDGQPWGLIVWQDWCEPVAQQPGLPEAYWGRIDPKDVRSGLGFIRRKARINAPGRAAMLDFKNVPDVDPQVLLAAAMAKSDLWPLLKRRFCYIMATNRFVDTFTGQDMSSEALDLKMLSQLPDLAALMPAGTNTRNASFTKLLMSQPDRLVAESMTYDPGKPRIMDGEHDTLVFNLWRPGFSQLLPNVTMAGVQPWIDFLAFIYGGLANAMTAIKWMAFVIQHPDKKPNWHQMLITKPGIGKDMMLRPFIYAVGVKNTSMIGVDEVTSTFNEYLQARLVVLNEAKQRGGSGGKNSHDTANEMKKYLTCPPDKITVNRKGLRPYSIANKTCWIFTSNEDNPLYLGEDDRRFWVVDNRGADKLPSAEYTRMDRWINNNLHAVATFLAEYPLTSADMDLLLYEAPMTAAKKALISLNRDPIDTALTEIVEDARMGSGPLACLVATSNDLMEALRERGLMVNHARFGRRLRQIAGCVPAHEDPNQPNSAGAVWHKGRVLRIWRLGDKDAQGNDLTKLSKTQLADLYESKKYNFPAASVLPFPATNVSQP